MKRPLYFQLSSGARASPVATWNIINRKYKYRSELNLSDMIVLAKCQTFATLVPVYKNLNSDANHWTTEIVIVSKLDNQCYPGKK